MPLMSHAMQPAMPHMQPPPMQPQMPHNVYGDQQPLVQAEEPMYYNPASMYHPISYSQPPLPTPHGLRAPSPNMHMMMNPVMSAQMQQLHNMSLDPQTMLPKQQELNVSHSTSGAQILDSRSAEVQRQMEEEGAFVDTTVPEDEAVATHAARTANGPLDSRERVDPPEDEPPSLSKRDTDSRDTDGNIGFGGFSRSSGHPESGTLYGAKSVPSVRTDFDTKLVDEDDFFVDEPEDQPLSPMSENDLFSSGPDVEIAPSHDYLQAASDLSKSQLSSFPPKSPTSEFSQSPAMKGAQEMLRRNRQRRLLEVARKRQLRDAESPEDERSADDAVTFSSPRGESDSEMTFETGSDMASAISGSSAWNESPSSNPDRGSRRALILQMAKARMRSNKSSTLSPSSTASPIPEDSIEEMRDEKKFDAQRDTDIDLTGDLD